MESSELIIELKNVKFFAFHGLYEEERKVGGYYMVDLTARFEANHNTVTQLDDTVNYEKLYEIVKAEMKMPRELLETIAQTTSEKIHRNFPRILELMIRIEKKDPPIINFTGNVAVTYRKQF